MMQLKILMIDDDVSFLKIYIKILKRKGYLVSTAINGDIGLKILSEQKHDIVICDVAMPNMNGIEVLKEIIQRFPNIQVIMLTGEGSLEGAIESIKLGAYSYMLKPVDTEQLLLNIKNAAKLLFLDSENKQLKSQIDERKNQIEFVGGSDAIKKIKDEIEQIKLADSSVLITGESGTGKEIAANLIHYKSRWKDGPFIKVNCAALTENLLESELFGHEKGAFTGAIASKKGRFELAAGGTLFLDEITELNMALQSKLLRVLQENEFERVGGTQTIHVNFRLICASNKDIKEEIKNNRFREDLFFRINVVPLRLPPLRDRPEDIMPILKHYLKHYCQEMNKPEVKIGDEAQMFLTDYQWPGNVREVRNMAERIIVFSKGEEIKKTDLPEEVHKEREFDPTQLEHLDFRNAKAAFEKAYLETMLHKNHWNISATSKEINIARKNLQAKIKQLNITKSAT